MVQRCPGNANRFVVKGADVRSAKRPATVPGDGLRPSAPWIRRSAADARRHHVAEFRAVGQRAQLPDSQPVNPSGEPDAGNPHVRFEEGPQGAALGSTLL